MSRQYLNLSGKAWSQLRSNWKLPASPMLMWQTLGPGAALSTVAAMQKATFQAQLAQASLANAVVVLGYWRSGTTLLHELLCLDERYTYPTTHACMNPHHFLFSEASALASRGGASAQRPMDEMQVTPASPQEDEFALLALGARSPYEALIFPQLLARALELTDPNDLSSGDRATWRERFIEFLRGVSFRGSGKPIILKSPTHGARVDTLRELLPDARYVLIVRDPMTNFESVVRMWQRMFETYALGPIPDSDSIRECVLADRRRFEEKLATATASLPSNRFMAIRYESLVEDPVELIGQLYAQLELQDFSPVREAISAEVGRRKDYRAKAQLPSPAWQEQLRKEWVAVFQRYDALA